MRTYYDTVTRLKGQKRFSRSYIVDYLSETDKAGQRDAGEMTSIKAIERHYGYYRTHTVIPRKPKDPICERFMVRSRNDFILHPIVEPCAYVYAHSQQKFVS